MVNAVRAVLAGFILVVALFFGVAIIDGIVTDEEGIRLGAQESVLLDDAGEWVAIDTVEGFDETVVNSRGYAVALTGADDSYVQSTADIDVAPGQNWTVSAWGYVDNDSETEKQTLVEADGQVVIKWDGPNYRWSAWYYDDSTRNSYRVNVSTYDQPEEWHNVVVRANGTHLTIFLNGTAGESVDITDSNIHASPTGTANWHGRIDEIRTFDDALDEATIAELESDPVGPQPGTNRTARAMFDEPDASTQLLFFSSGSMATSNATFEAGLPGQEMQGVSLISQITGSTDYVWDTDGPAIQPVEGGELDGAPVAYVTYNREGGLAEAINAWSMFSGLAALIPLILIFLAIMAIVRRA